MDFDGNNLMFPVDSVDFPNKANPLNEKPGVVGPPSRATSVAWCPLRPSANFGMSRLKNREQPGEIWRWIMLNSCWIPMCSIFFQVESPEFLFFACWVTICFLVEHGGESDDVHESSLGYWGAGLEISENAWTSKLGQGINRSFSFAWTRAFLEKHEWWVCDFKHDLVNQHSSNHYFAQGPPSYFRGESTNGPIMFEGAIVYWRIKKRTF